MEESLKGHILSGFSMEEPDLRTYSPLAMAFLGDAVYSMVIRTIVFSEGNRQAEKMHNKTKKLVCAAAQAAVGDAIQPLLTPEEAAIYRRGRNANPVHRSKSASAEEYFKATALETLCGYLYMKDDSARLIELIRAGLNQKTET